MTEIITDEELNKKLPLSSFYLKSFDGEDTDKLSKMPIMEIKKLLEESEFVKDEDENGIKYFFEIGEKYNISDDFISFIGYPYSSEYKKNNDFAFQISILKNTGEIIRSDAPLTKEELKLFN
jgi:hypothetical protein